MDKTVEIKNLTKLFGDFTAVDNISFSVERGEIFGFLGPNGAGKSTTIRMLCGIIIPSSGGGNVAGYDILKEQNKIKNIIGYMSQRFSLYEDLRVIENLEFFGSVYGLEGKKLKDSIDRALKMADMTGNKDLLVKSLPAGIKQRLALGASVLHDPEILFLDEPTSGVDPVMRKNFWDIIYRFSEEGRTIFVTTHYMDEAEHCDRIALIIGGKIIALDSPDMLKQSLPYEVYSLRVDNFIQVFDSLSSVKFIEEAAIFGSEIHMLCQKDFPFKREIDRVLKKKNIGSYKIEKVLPTLEDVFVTSVRKYDA